MSKMSKTLINFYSYSGFIFLVVVIMLVFLSSLATPKSKEGYVSYSNYNLTNLGKYPITVEKPILNSYPNTGAKYVSDNN